MSAAQPAPKKALTGIHSDSESVAAARVIAGADGTILYANDSFERLSGMSSLKGYNIADIVNFHDPGGVARGGLHVVSFPATRVSAELQFDWADAADGQRFMIASAQEMRGPETIQEIASPQTMDELGHFLDLSRDLMAIAGADGSLMRGNVSLMETMALSEIEVRSRMLIDLIHPEDRGTARPVIQNLLRGEDGITVDFEARLLRPDGYVLYIDWQMKRGNGQIYVLGRDITSIKEHETALRRHERQLSEAEAIAHMGRWRWAAGDERIEWSHEIYRIFGVTADKFSPTLTSVNSLLHRRDVGRLIQAFQRAIIEQNDYDMDFRVIRPDGETRFVRCEGRCEHDQQGEVIALYGIMQDITQTMRHQSQLTEAKEDAERAYAAKTQFLANMSHELRTPLNAIIGFSEMMQRQILGPIGTEKYLEYIAGIRESGEHLLDLISDILDMSKIEAGKYELSLEQLNAGKIIRLALHMMEGRALDSAIKMAAEIEDENATLIADRRALMQILLNLLSNAVKFSKNNGKITVECASRRDHLEIRVCDNGIGIPAHKLKAVMRPFEQAASHYTREHEGTGLGLAITKELTELHGGSLQIESSIGVGTTVTVKLPYDASATRQDRSRA